MSRMGCKIMESNSSSFDSSGKSYFSQLYDTYRIVRITANRCVNPNRERKVTELIIMNY